MDNAVPPHDIDTRRRTELVLASTILTGLSVLVIVLRVIARAWILRSFGADDWHMVAAMFSLVSYFALIIAGLPYGQGLHAYDWKLEWYKPALKMIIAIQMVYYLTVYFVKTSILMFYLRLASNRTFRAIVWGTFTALSLVLVVSIIVVHTQCTPLAEFWNTSIPDEEKNCIDDTAFFYFTSVFSIITDVWILLLSIKLLWKIDRSPMHKFMLVCVFLVGTFACIASCIRLTYIQVYTLSDDPLYDSVPINCWSFIEISIAILCACVPALKLFLCPGKHRKSRKGSADSIPTSEYSVSSHRGAPVMNGYPARRRSSLDTCSLPRPAPLPRPVPALVRPAMVESAIGPLDEDELPYYRDLEEYGIRLTDSNSSTRKPSWAARN